jgi:hypothetical protein
VAIMRSVWNDRYSGRSDRDHPRRVLWARFGGRARSGGPGSRIPCRAGCLRPRARPHGRRHVAHLGTHRDRARRRVASVGRAVRCGMQRGVPAPGRGQPRPGESAQSSGCSADDRARRCRNRRRRCVDQSRPRNGGCEQQPEGVMPRYMLLIHGAAEGPPRSVDLAAVMRGSPRRRRCVRCSRRGER